MGVCKRLHAAGFRDNPAAPGITWAMAAAFDPKPTAVYANAARLVVDLSLIPQTGLKYSEMVKAGLRQVKTASRKGMVETRDFLAAITPKEPEPVPVITPAERAATYADYPPPAPCAADGWYACHGGYYPVGTGPHPEYVPPARVVGPVAKPVNAPAKQRSLFGDD
jgi:hypothetical protein